MIEAFEGFSSVQYRDSVGVPTIGFGTTAADVSPLPWRCTRTQAEGWLRRKLRDKYEPAVRAIGVPLNQNQFDALVSFAYNLGPGVFAGQIGTDLRARRYLTAANDLMLYVRAGGVVLQGLVNRRSAERRLFLTPAAPLDPMRYAYYPTRIQVDRRVFDERAIVKEYDRLRRRWWRHRKRLNVLRAQCKILADRCRTEALKERPPAWNDHRHLGFRHWRLDMRANGKRVRP